MLEIGYIGLGFKAKGRWRPRWEEEGLHGPPQDRPSALTAEVQGISWKKTCMWN